jgi:hypothetical protein
MVETFAGGNITQQAPLFEISMHILIPDCVCMEFQPPNHGSGSCSKVGSQLLESVGVLTGWLVMVETFAGGNITQQAPLFEISMHILIPDCVCMEFQEPNHGSGSCSKVGSQLLESVGVLTGWLVMVETFAGGNITQQAPLFEISMHILIPDCVCMEFQPPNHGSGSCSKVGSQLLESVGVLTGWLVMVETFAGGNITQQAPLFEISMHILIPDCVCMEFQEPKHGSGSCSKVGSQLLESVGVLTAWLVMVETFAGGNITQQAPLFEISMHILIPDCACMEFQEPKSWIGKLQQSWQSVVRVGRVLTGWLVMVETFAGGNITQQAPLFE